MEDDRDEGRLASHLPPGVGPLALEVSRLRAGYGAEPVAIEGLVSEEPQGTGSASIAVPCHVHHLRLEPWRLAGGGLRTEPLVVLRAIPNPARFAWQVPSGTLVAVRALLSASSRRAVVVAGLPDPPVDAAFQAEIDRLRHPPVVTLPGLGALAYEAATRRYVGAVAWPERRVWIAIEADGRALGGPALALAEAVWATRAAVAAALAVAVRAWAEAEGVAVPDLVGLAFAASGTVEAWHDDDGSGHAVVVRGPPGGPFDVAVEG